MKFVPTPELRKTAQRIGTLRQELAVSSGKHDRFGAELEDGLLINKVGALGEACVATVLGCYDLWLASYAFVDDPKSLDGDVAPEVEVRTTRRLGNRLVLHKDDTKDPPHHLFFHVVIEPPYKVAYIVGWLFGEDGKRPEYWADPQGTGRWAYFVPNERLEMGREDQPT